MGAEPFIFVYLKICYQVSKMKGRSSVLTYHPQDHVEEDDEKEEQAADDVSALPEEAEGWSRVSVETDADQGEDDGEVGRK